MAHDLVFGGVAMTTVGSAGPDVRGDVRVTVLDDGRSIEVRSTVASMYGDAIREQAERVLGAFGNPNLVLEIEDSGALPLVLEARLEAALSKHLGAPLPEMLEVVTEGDPEARRRTRLYVPASVPKFFANAALFQPDAIVLDLEDSVAREAKFEARVLARRALWGFDWGFTERMVRINDGNEGLEDLRVIAGGGAEVVLVPKVESPERLLEVESVLESQGQDARILPLIESAIGVENAYQIARSTDRIVAMSLGLEDYLADIGAQRSDSQEESMWAQGRIVNAARAAGIEPLASVFPRFDDPQAVYEYAASSRRRGYEGIGCIHPSQIAPAHRAFGPTETERESAQRVVDAFERAMAEGVAAISVEGSMVDEPVYRRALALLNGGGI